MDLLKIAEKLTKKELESLTEKVRKKQRDIGVSVLPNDGEHSVTTQKESAAVRVAHWFLAARGLQVNRKDKDLMSDTGGTSKGRRREPEMKPPRDDVRKRYRTKAKPAEDRDEDVDRDKDKGKG